MDKYRLIDKIRKDILSNKKSYPDNSVWDRIIPEYSGYAIVHTSDGIKYCGRILFHTKGLGKDGKANKEMFLHEPVILNKNMGNYSALSANHLKYSDSTLDTTD